MFSHRNNSTISCVDKGRSAGFTFAAYLNSGLLISVCLFCSITVSATDANSEHVVSLDDAIHLLTRTGLGAHPAEVAELTGMTRSHAIETVLQGFSSDANDRMPAWVDAAPPYMFRPGMLRADRRQFNQDRNLEFQNLRSWWVEEMLTTASPQTERLVLFWHNHFASSYKGLGNLSTGMARQNRLFREHASGSFRSLLHGILQDAVMLRYLDNNTNRKKAPNENLARELFELFTLGEGNYTENDIKEAARALTGHTFVQSHNLAFRVISGQHDAGTKTIFGVTGKFSGHELVELILDQKKTAEFIATKFWRHYINENDINESSIKQWARVFRDSDYDIGALFKELLQSEDFWAASNRHSIVKSPVDLVIGGARSLGDTTRDVKAMIRAMEEQGQSLFNPPNVAGWPGGEAWVTPGRLLKRLQWLRGFGRVAKSGKNDTAEQMLAENMQTGNSPVAMAEVDAVRSGQASDKSGAASMSVDTVYVSKLDNPVSKKGTDNRAIKQRNRSTMMLQLDRLVLEGKQWRNWMFRVVAEYDGSTVLTLNRYDCWPDCLDVWPDCARVDRHDNYSRQMTFNLKPKDSSNGKKNAGSCSLEDLSPNDRLLLEAIAGNLTELYSLASSDARLRNPVKRKAYDAWHSVFSDLDNTSQITLAVVPDDGDNSVNMMRNPDMAEMPEATRLFDESESESESESGQNTDKSLASGSTSKLTAVLRESGINVRQTPDQTGLAMEKINRDLSETAAIHFATDGQRSLRHPLYQLR